MGVGVGVGVWRVGVGGFCQRREIRGYEKKTGCRERFVSSSFRNRICPFQ